MEEIKIDSKFADQNGEIMIVELSGHVDQSNSSRLQKMFDNIIQSGCYKIIVDFTKLYYMSSSGWGIFVGEIKRFRKNGGDIKLAGMNPEINEVYQMLEFYHILEDYPTVETAAASFKANTEELDLAADEMLIPKPETTNETVEAESSTEEIELFESQSGTTEENTENSDDKEEMSIDIEVGTDFGATSMTEFIPHTLKQNVKLADLPLMEKVKRVVAQNPLLGVLGIRKVLKHEQFGFTRVGLFKLIRLLKELDLNSKDKRYRFYRSC